MGKAILITTVQRPVLPPIRPAALTQRPPSPIGKCMAAFEQSFLAQAIPEQRIVMK